MKRIISIILTLTIVFSVSAMNLVKAEASSNEFVEQEYTVNQLESCSKLLGRAYKDTDDMVLAMSGSGVEYGIYVEGDIKIKLHVTVQHDPNLPRFIGVMFDGDYENRQLIKIKSGLNEITVQTGLNNGEHTIAIWKPNEYQFSTYRLKSLSFKGKLGKTPAKKKYTIDFYGDSITVASGNMPLGEDGLYDPNGSYDPYSTNAFDGYAAVASRKLGADFNICACSGYGIAYGFGEFSNPPGAIISKIYDYASPKDNLLWDYNAYTPDLAVVSLGQNDSGHPEKIGDVYYHQALKERIKELVEKIRANDKTIPIIWIGGLMSTDGAFGSEFVRVSTALSEVINENGYEDIYFKIIPGDGAGGNWHPSAKAHKSIGETLATYIETLDILNKGTKVASSLVDDFNSVSSVPSHYSKGAIVDSPVANDNHGKVLKIDAKTEYSSVVLKAINKPENFVGIKFDLYITQSATMGVKGIDSSNNTYGRYDTLGSFPAGKWVTITDIVDTRYCSAENMSSFEITSSWTKADTIYIDNVSYLALDYSCEHIAVEGSENVVEPTLRNDGYTEYTCELCGELFVTDVVPAVGASLTIDMTTIPGASIRLNDKTGLRFYTEVDKQKIADLRADGFTVELGTLIAPYDIVFRNDLTFALAEDNFVDVKYQSNDYYTEGTEFSGIVGSIVNIKESTTANPNSGNIVRNFVARGYAKITDKSGASLVFYADYEKHNGRSLGYVSQMLRNDTDEFTKDIYAQFAEKVNFWADRFVIDSDPNGSDKW